MPVKFKKKILKMRGTKSCGYGMKKKHRGGGSRGGRGKAGYGKHKFTMMLQKDPDHFVKKGFTIHGKKRVLCINVSQLDTMSQDGRVVFNGKILGSGKILTALTVVASSVTQKAREKIEAVGGKVEVESKPKKSNVQSS
jgi:large subunit ribosomal protein L15